MLEDDPEGGFVECNTWHCMLLAAAANANLIVLGTPILDRMQPKLIELVRDSNPDFLSSPACPDAQGHTVKPFEFKKQIDFRVAPIFGTTIHGVLIGLGDPYSLDNILGRTTVTCRGLMWQKANCCECKGTIGFDMSCETTDTFDFRPSPKKGPLYNLLAAIWERDMGDKMGRPDIFGQDKISWRQNVELSGCEK